MEKFSIFIKNEEEPLVAMILGDLGIEKFCLEEHYAGVEVEAECSQENWNSFISNFGLKNK